MNRKLTTIITLLTITAFYACDKDYEMKASTADLSGKAYIRFVHAAPNFRAVTGQRDSFNIYVNGRRLNSPFLTYASVFPVATTSSYIAVYAGAKSYRLSVAGVNNPDSITVFTTPLDTLMRDMKRTIIITDTVTAAAGIIYTNDLYSQPAVGYYNLRFMNMVLNDTAGKTVDIYSTRRNANIGTNLPPRAITAFGAFPSAAGLNDTLFVRRSGTTFNLATLAYLPASQRTYTLIYRGNGTVTTGTKARTLAVITNE
jgi:hypothetical protein